MSLQSPRSTRESSDDRERAIDELGPWFHNLHLPGGYQTAADHPLGDFPAFKWEQFAGVIPADLRGTRALDIGCNAGYHSFQLAQRGAEVLAIDSDEHYLRQGRWAAQWLDPEERVEFRAMAIYDLVDVTERFDLVLFLGVLYHLRYPQLALDLVARAVKRQMVFQTLTMPGHEPLDPPADLPFSARDRLTEPGWPRAAFIEHSLAGDPTNWWAPDDACVQAMLRSAGLRVTGTPGHELYLCEPAPDAHPTTGLREAELRSALRLDRSAS
jgi:tRNA (mo5U34)-methyltransferase